MVRMATNIAMPESEIIPEKLPQNLAKTMNKMKGSFKQPKTPQSPPSMVKKQPSSLKVQDLANLSKLPTIVYEKEATLETSQMSEDGEPCNLEIKSTSNFEEDGPPMKPQIIVDDRINDEIIQEFCNEIGLSLLDVSPNQIPKFRLSLGQINFTLLIDKALFIQAVYGGYCSYYETR